MAATSPPPALSARRERILYAAVLGVSALATLAGFEIFLRRAATHVVRAGGSVEQDPSLLVVETPRGRRLVPRARVVIRNHYLSRRDVPMEINSVGFRDGEIPEDRAPGERRILVLGDSITWADYLPAEETYVRRAEAHLRERQGRRETTLINAGVGDVGLREELDILEERGLALHPDEVVVAFYLNDSRPPWGFEGEVGRPGWLRRHSLVADRVYRNLVLWRWIRDQGSDRFAWVKALDSPRWALERGRFLEMAALARHDWGAAWRPESWTALEPEFARLREHADGHGFTVALVAFPVAFQVYAGFLEASPQRRLQEVAERFGFRYLDLLPVLRERHRGRKLYFDHCHPNREGNEIIGAALAEFLAGGPAGGPR